MTSYVNILLRRTQSCHFLCKSSLEGFFPSLGQQPRPMAGQRLLRNAGGVGPPGPGKNLRVYHRTYGKKTERKRWISLSDRGTIWSTSWILPYLIWRWWRCDQVYLDVADVCNLEKLKIMRLPRRFLRSKASWFQILYSYKKFPTFYKMGPLVVINGVVGPL